MSENNIIGRAKEKEKLSQLYEDDNPCLFLFYGRRRIGKTWLVTQFFNEKSDSVFLSFKAEYELRDSPEIQSYNIRKEIINLMYKLGIDHSGISFDKRESIWPETFNYLEKSINILLKSNPDKKIVIFFDEFPWFYPYKKKKEFIGTFSGFWSKFVLQHKEKNRIKIFASGSATRTILQDLIGAKGALFQNKDQSVYKLKSFNLTESKEFLDKLSGVKLSNEDLIKLYFAVGGVADYLAQFKPKHTVDSFINDFYFKNESNYNKGLSEFLKSSFEDHPHHRAVLDAIALSKKGMTQKEIVDETNLSRREVSQLLLELVETDIISRNIELSPSAKIDRKAKNH